MKFIRKLPDVDEIQKMYELTSVQYENRKIYIQQIKNILSGQDDRKLIIVGPCSADNEKAVLDYTYRLSNLADKVSSKLLLVPRVYTSKPRTTSIGYKGMLHSPISAENEDLLQGIIASRRLHMKVINETNLFAADEMLYPEEIYYLADVLAYMTVGARSVEDQNHRMVASDDNVPVGMKNPIGGNKMGLVNSIVAAQSSHKYIYRSWEVETMGNMYAHGILRGYTSNEGKNHSNYHYDDLTELYDMLVLNNVKNPSVLVDCNHANSNKKYDEQPRIAREVIAHCKENSSIDTFVKGLMVESYIEDGNQKIGRGIYGKSITDACIGWEKTSQLIQAIADIL